MYGYNFPKLVFGLAWVNAKRNHDDNWRRLNVDVG